MSKQNFECIADPVAENILVRTYEDRLDLMRVLIIGPEGTPYVCQDYMRRLLLIGSVVSSYTDAPFVFDVYLNPTKFPNEPPIVHFHSYTNGHGRCNRKYPLNIYGNGQLTQVFV